MILPDSDSTIDQIKMESIPECRPSFPLACYQYSLRNRPEPWHWHEEFEIAVVEQGTARILFEGQEQLIPAGTGGFPSGHPGYAAKVKGMLLYIWQNYRNTIQLSDIAASAGISGNNCLLCFRKTVGLSPIQYLKNYRLQQAAKLLRETDRSIQEIVDLCGFNDTSYFIRSFSGKYHMSPTKYRKMESGE